LGFAKQCQQREKFPMHKDSEIKAIISFFFITLGNPSRTTREKT